jgi:hypothetical protein
VAAEPIDLRAGSAVLEGVAGDSLELQAELTCDARTTAMGLRVRRPSTGGGVEISFAPKSGVLTVDGLHKQVGCARRIGLRVFLDKRVLEVYAADGAAAVFKPIRAKPGDVGVEAFAAGGTARLATLQAWPMRPAGFSLEHYT